MVLPLRPQYCVGVGYYERQQVVASLIKEHGLPIFAVVEQDITVRRCGRTGEVMSGNRAKPELVVHLHVLPQGGVHEGGGA